MKQDYSKTDFTTDLNLWQKVMYYLVWGIVYSVSLLPFPVIYGISDFLYIIIYKVAKYRRALTRKNLRDSFPEKSEAELLDIERKFYHYFCDYIMETFKLASMSKEEMRRRVNYSNLEVLHEHLRRGNNMICYFGHYCNWEWLTSIGLHCINGFQVGQVYHILENKVMNAVILKIRSAMGTESISMQILLRKVVEKRRNNQPILLGFNSDQVPLYQATRHWTDFLNHKDTLVITGTEQVARKFDFVCLYADYTRIRRGYYNLEVKTLCLHPKDTPEWSITDMYFKELEKTIRNAPQYWLWTHNRWKRTREGFEEWKKNEEEKKANA